MKPAVSPYQGLPARAFWRTGVAEAGYPPADLFQPRWPLSRNDRIVTAGSCFAQHVGRALRAQGFQVIDTEPASQDPRNIGANAAEYGYGLYSARYGNIYTVRQLRQLLAEAYGHLTPDDPVWHKDDRFFDALRPNIEPGGFDSPDAVLKARHHHLAKIREAFSHADVFVFTLGLTETWVNKTSGQVYPTAPGTIAGTFDPQLHGLKIFRVAEIKDDFEQVLTQLKTINPKLRVLLTVSPVPLTASAGGDHVLTATTYSKSALRACAGELREDHPEVDYFPSYEIVTSTKSAGTFFEPNHRSVTEQGVARVMRTFIAAYGYDVGPEIAPPAADDDVLRQQRKMARREAKRTQGKIA